HQNKILPVFFDFPDVNSAELAEAEQLRYRIYREHFNAMEKDCQRILLLSMQKFSSKDIADTMGYGSENYAKTKKYNCKERLKRSIMGDPRIQDLHD
ncbi:MAG TPA: hypothetical protein DCL86_03430, partial [Bacteroidales bacterium]|nr:hypothetical protein [Bacteroidales bacterium]